MRKVVGSWIWRMLAACLIVSFAIPILLWSFNDQMSWRQLAISYLQAIVYSVCIGSTLTVLIAGTWCRLSRLSTALAWTIRAFLIVAASGLGCLMAGLVMWAIYGASYGYRASFIASWKIAIVLSAFATAFLTTYERHRTQLRVTETELKTKELERERALKLATEARLSSLESRIHPHFLFNTINSISSLMHEDTPRAERMLNQMSELLRFSLDSTQRGLVPLERELRIVEDYLEIEAARFCDRLHYEVQIPESSLQAGVPPLSLQTLVENSVKYAVSARRRGAEVEITGQEAAGCLILTVRDNGPGFSSEELTAGHGLSNLKERMTALFGNEGELKMVSSGQGATVTLKMPLMNPIPTSPQDASVPSPARI